MTTSSPCSIRRYSNNATSVASLPQLYASILASAFILWMPSSKAEENAASEKEYFQEFPVVLTASRLSQPLSEAPSAMTVIDRAMIKASGFRTVPDLMRVVPGMYVGFVDANHPVVSLHGANDEYAHRMQILIDGRSVYLPPFGGVNWADLPLLTEDIERIEIVRGPSSASHGSNSFYGVINIITRDALSQEGVGVSLTAGDANDVSVRYGKVGEKFDYRLSAGHRSDQGIDNARLNDHNATAVANFRGNFHPNGTDSFDLQLGSSKGKYGYGIAGRPEDAFRDTSAQSSFLQGSWLRAWTASYESKLTYSNTVRNYVDPYLCINSQTCQGSPPGVLVSSGFTTQAIYSQRNEMELQNTHQLGDSNRLVWGGVIRRDYADYPLFFVHSHTVNSWQVFAHDEWRMNQATVLNIGTMFEDDGMGNKNNSPRASLNYHFTPQHTMRMGISTATRSPVMTEAFIDANNTIWGGAYVPPAVPLTPEKIVSKEIGYLGEFRSVGITVDARVYIDQVSDLIWWDKYVSNGLASDPDSYKNLLSAEYRGVDATVKYQWDEGRSFLVFNYAYQEASAGLSGTPTQYAKPLVSSFYQTEYFNQFPQTVPTNSASLLLSQRFADSWQFSAGYYYREPVRVSDVSPDVTRENQMNRLDLRMAKTFKFARANNAEVALVLQNITQDKYTKYGTVNAVAETYYAQRGWLTATVNF